MHIVKKEEAYEIFEPVSKFVRYSRKIYIDNNFKHLIGVSDISPLGVKLGEKENTIIELCRRWPCSVCLIERVSDSFDVNSSGMFEIPKIMEKYQVQNILINVGFSDDNGFFFYYSHYDYSLLGSDRIQFNFKISAKELIDYYVDKVRAGQVPFIDRKDIEKCRHVSE